MTILSPIKSITMTSVRQNINVLFLAWLCLTSFTANADPASDLTAFQGYFTNSFPAVNRHDFSMGIYAIDPISRKKWEETEKFPPYDSAVNRGKQHYNTPFNNGRSYADCLPKTGREIAHLYPKFDDQQNQVITLAKLINQCREQNNESPLSYTGQDIVSLVAYLTYTARGQVRNIVIQSDAAVNAYNKGKNFYYARRGALNMACAHCHVDNAGKRLRNEIISPALGQVNAFPTYRSSWAEIGTLHRRFADCNQITQAKPFSNQSEEYRNLEYFLSYMNNGIKMSGPSSRQ